MTPHIILEEWKSSVYIFEGTLNSDILSPNLHWQVEVIYSYSTDFLVIPVSVMWHILGAFLEQESEDLDCRTAQLWFMYHSEMLQKSLWCILRSCSAVSDSDLGTRGGHSSR